MQRRRAFSLVELLVSMALVIFIMTIISSAFVAGLESVRLLKAQNDMQAYLRVAATTIRDDLGSQHFPTIPRPYVLSGVDLTSNPPPQYGYFRIMQGTDPQAAAAPQAPPPLDNYYWENPKDTGPASFCAVDHTMAFTRKDASNGQWYEVAYFLQPNGATAGLTPLYALYRHQVGPFPLQPNTNTPTLDLSQPYYRYGMVPCDPTNPPGSLASSIPSMPNTSMPNTMVGSPATVLNFSQTNQRIITMPTWQQLETGLTSPNAAATCTLTIDSTWQGNFAANTPGMPASYINNPAPNWPSGGAMPSGPPMYPPAGSPTPNNNWQTVDPRGDDILLTNVISFEIRVFSPQVPQCTRPVGVPGSQFVNLFDALALLGSTNSQFWNGNTLPAVFDTWFQPSPTMTTAAQTAGDTTMLNIPLKINIKAIQITIRIWDERTQQTRQMTIIQNV